jgi:hypothetical protein
MRLTIFGDSHVEVLRAGVGLIPASLAVEMHSSWGPNWINPTVSVDAEGLWHFQANDNPAIPPLNLTLRPGGKFLFSTPLHTAPFIRDKVWQDYCPWQVQGQHPQLVPLPDAVLHSWLARRLGAVFEYLDRMKDAGFDVTVIEAPRPLARAPSRYGISAGIVRAVDAICRRYICDVLAKHEISIIQVPIETHDDGLTSESYSGVHPKHAHHGNAAFGQAMMAHILQMLETEAQNQPTVAVG